MWDTAAQDAPHIQSLLRNLIREADLGASPSGSAIHFIGRKPRRHVMRSALGSSPATATLAATAPAF